MNYFLCWNHNIP